MEAGRANCDPVADAGCCNSKSPWEVSPCSLAFGWSFTDGARGSGAAENAPVGKKY